MSVSEKAALADIVAGAVGIAVFNYLAVRESIRQGVRPFEAVTFRWAIGAKGKARLYRDLGTAWMILCLLAGLLLMAVFSKR